MENVEYVLTVIGMLVSLIFSIISVVQARNAKQDAKKANRLAEDANKMAEKSNKLADGANKVAEESNRLAERANKLTMEEINEVRKEHTPVLIFVGGVSVEEVPYDRLCTEAVFDYADTLKNEQDGDSEEEVFAVKATIKNIGTGIVTSIKVMDFFIQSGNENTIRNKVGLDECKLAIYEKAECEHDFILNVNETSDIYFTIPNEKIDDMRAFFDEKTKYVIGMSVQISSIVDSEYKQSFLWGTAYNRVIVHNSFEKIDIVSKKE